MALVMHSWLATLKNRRRAQAGTTLIELLVSLTIISLSLALIVGTISTGLLDATVANRNAAVQAVLQHEMEKIAAMGFSSTASYYSDCFSMDDPASPPSQVAYAGSCPTSAYKLRADVSWQWYQSPNTLQVWQIGVSSWPAGFPTGASGQPACPGAQQSTILCVYKTSHQ